MRATHLKSSFLLATGFSLAASIAIGQQAAKPVNDGLGRIVVQPRVDAPCAREEGLELGKQR